jgi:hypothetical protein
MTTKPESAGNTAEAVARITVREMSKALFKLEPMDGAYSLPVGQHDLYTHPAKPAQPDGQDGAGMLPGWRFRYDSNKVNIEIGPPPDVAKSSCATWMLLNPDDLPDYSSRWLFAIAKQVLAASRDDEGARG